MPRLPPSLIRTAYQIDPLLARLLRECRDLGSARNELRWMREHVRLLDAGAASAGASRPKKKLRLRRMVNERARGKPLQYILGDQPFGGLDILCRKGVLIPRPETETYTTRTARWILSHYQSQSHLQQQQYRCKTPLRILDLCTGTGCIPLLLHSLLSPTIPSLHIVGVDISEHALALSRRNLRHNIDRENLSSRAADEVQFVQADLLHHHYHHHHHPGEPPPPPPSPDEPLGQHQTWDILISNPPYISPRAFRDGTTRRSVRLYEPELALVPTNSHPPASASPQTTATTTTTTTTPSSPETEHAQQDSFYPALLTLSAQVRARLTVLECGDVAQARRVVHLAARRFGCDQEDSGGLRSDGSSLPARMKPNVGVGIWRCDRDECAGDAGRVGDDEGYVEDGGARVAVLVREGE